MDEATAQGRGLDFARLCVEVTYDFTFPESVLVLDEATGNWEEVQVTYDWRPTPCVHCQTFGHDQASCAATLLLKGKQAAPTEGGNAGGDSPPTEDGGVTSTTTGPSLDSSGSPPEQGAPPVPQVEAPEQSEPLATTVEDRPPLEVVLPPQEEVLTEPEENQDQVSTLVTTEEEDTYFYSTFEQDTIPQGEVERGLSPTRVHQEEIGPCGRRTIFTRGCLHNPQEEDIPPSSARKQHVELKRLGPTATTIPPTRQRKKDKAPSPKGVSRLNTDTFL